MSFLVLAMTSFAAEEGRRPENVAELLVASENLEMIRNPDRVDACVLRYIPPPDGNNLNEERYEETEFVRVPDEMAASMRSALLRESNYGWNYAKGCWPRYHTRLRFHRNGKVLAIDFCFTCSILLIRRDGVPIGGEDFEDGVFLNSMHKLFPGDSALKKVIERKANG